MGVNVTITKSTGSISQYVEKRLEQIQRETIVLLMRIGEECVNVARNNGKYKNRTGNLRSSIGYMVVQNGTPIDIGGFVPIHTEEVGESMKGEDVGKGYINSLASRFPKGITLVLVAGMNYAAYVNDKGYDVLDSAEITAERLVEQLFTNNG